ncbi:hypothetical protein Tco_0921791 [Tanacetum coccineum]
MEMEHDIENMTLNEYLEYEAEKERRSWWNVQSKSSPTRYEGADFNSSHCDKSVTLDFMHYYKDTLIDKYYVLPPLLPCFRPSQPHNEFGYESPDENDNVDIESMTIAEYNLYPYRLMHVSGAWLILGCRETFQAGLVGCYTENDEVACECGCCSRKQTWSMA